MRCSRDAGIFRRLAVVVLALSIAVPVAAQHTQAIQRFWVPDSSVWDVEPHGSNLYVGGEFTRLGPYTGGFSALDSTNAEPDLALPDVAGAVNAFASDGAGGWYLGGDFSHVGGFARQNLAHILGDGRVSAWASSANDTVNAVLVAHGKVFVAGKFTSVDGQTRNRLAAFNGASGALDTWNPNANNTVNALAFYNGTVYAAGSFSSIGGLFRSRLVGLDPDTGKRIVWYPSPSNTVHDMIINNGVVYIGGYFTTVSGSPRNRIAAIDATTATVLSWNPNANQYVDALFVSGTTVYAGGNFSMIGGQTRNGIAALDASTGLATSWDPDADGVVSTITVSGSIVYAGGTFDTIGGASRNHLAALNSTTGAATAWDPHPFGSVKALEAAGDDVMAGGGFHGMGGVARDRIAALDLVTGEATAWNPGADDRVHAIATDGGAVYIGGYFLNAGGQMRQRIAAIDPVTSLAIPGAGWDLGASARVLDLEVAGGIVYAAGDFTTIGGEPRSRAAAIDGVSGIATSWNTWANNTVLDLEISGSVVYAGGGFTSIGSRTRNNIAALSISTGSAISTWNANASSSVFSVKASGGSVYAAGGFTTIGGASRSRIAELNASNGTATTWNPAADDSVLALHLEGGSVFAGGDFLDIGGESRARLAELDSSSGNATAWRPEIPTTQYNNEIYDIEASGDLLFAAGLNQRIARQSRGYLSVFCLVAVPTTLTATPGGNNAIDLSWTGAGAPSTNIYRSTVSGGPYELVGSSTGSSFTDTTVEGGVLYYYTVTSVDSCESDQVAEVSASTSGACGAAPDFEGIAYANQTGDPICRFELGWRAATAPCGGNVEYAVYRDTAADFFPAVNNRLTSAVTGSVYVDTAALSPGTTYYYVVRASDAGNGAEDSNLIRMQAVPTGCTASAPSPVGALTARSSDLSVLVEWANPPVPYRLTRICWSGAAFPDDPSLCTNHSDYEGTPGSAGQGYPGSVLNGNEYFYSAFVNDAVDGSGPWSEGRMCASRPFDTPDGVWWSYSTGAASLAPSGILPAQNILTVSNDRFLHSVIAGSSGGMWPSGWTPSLMNGSAQARPSTVTFSSTTIGGASVVTFVSSLDGHVYAIDSLDGSTLWRSPSLGDGVTAAPSGILADYGGTLDHDVILVGSRTPTGGSKFFGLDPQTGAVLWAFDNGGGADAIGIISGQAQVDVANNRVYFASRSRGGGSPKTLWCLQLRDSDASPPYYELLWARDDVGDIDGSPTLRGGVLYVGNNTGEVFALDPDNPAVTHWSYTEGVGPVKSFVWADTTGTPTRLFFATTGQVHGLADNGSSATELWDPVSLSRPSPVILVNGELWIGSASEEGSLRRIDAATGAENEPIRLGDPAVAKTVGAPTYDFSSGQIAVGTNQGRIYLVEAYRP